MQTLKLIRDLVHPIADISFFMQLDNQSGKQLSDEAIAKVIKGNRYQATQKKIDEFVQRCNQQVAEAQKRVDEANQEYESALKDAKRSHPGGAPSGFFVDRSDINSVNHHNEEVERYNNKLDLHRRLCDKAERAKERYEDLRDKLRDKKADVEEQIREKREDLKPALDQDIIAFLSKLQQLAYDCIHNKNYSFEAFVFIYMAKKAYVFLFDYLDDSLNKKSASEVFKRLTDEMDRIAVDYPAEIQQGLAGIVGYVHEAYQVNQTILEEIQANLESLPYQTCEQNDNQARRLGSLPSEAEFSLQDIIDPVELAGVERQVQRRKGELEGNIQTLGQFLTSLAPTFSQISSIKATCEKALARMVQNKEKQLGETFNDALFILGMFNEAEQDEYLKKQKHWLEDVQTDAENNFGIDGLVKLIKQIMSTDLLTKSTQELLQSNVAFKFLGNQSKLTAKKQDLSQTVQKLNQTLQEIGRLPEEKSAEFSKNMGTWLGASLLPGINLIGALPIQKMLTQFAPAFASTNSAYQSLKENTSKRFQTFLFVQLCLAMVTGATAIMLPTDDGGKKPIVAGVASTYAASAGFLLLKRNQLKSFEPNL